MIEERTHWKVWNKEYPDEGSEILHGTKQDALTTAENLGLGDKEDLAIKEATLDEIDQYSRGG